MGFHYTDTLEKHNWVGGGLDAYIYHVTPTIVAKTVRRDRASDEKKAEHPVVKEIAFYKSLKERRDQCPHIVECFLMLPDHLFLSYCAHKALAPRLYERQERERGPNGFHRRLIKVKEYEDPGLIARWIQQLTSALEYVEKMGFCHNDLHASNCLLDSNFNLKLTDFGRAATVGQPLEGVLSPRAGPKLAGPLKGTYGLCSARTEHAAEWDRRFWELEFPDLERHEVFDGLISACWHNVYPTMALVAYDFKRKAKHIMSDAEYTVIDSAKERETCEALVRRGLLGPELAESFGPA
ncbi:kinase domain protein [Aspergillus carlsbadensis]|nr:kinase domain protein [Aspergillus carlsbadensis]